LHFSCSPDNPFQTDAAVEYIVRAYWTMISNSKTNDSHLIRLRPATVEDRQFVDNLVYTTMHRWVEATWPSDPEAQRYYYQINSFNPENTRIIQVENRDVGRLTTTARPDCLFIDEIHILPKYQRQGIGRRVIAQVLFEAAERRLPVKATILTVNRPSQEAFLGMGFQVVGERDHRYHILYKTGALNAHIGEVS